MTRIKPRNFNSPVTQFPGQATRERGAVRNVLVWAGIVALIAIVILLVGMKWKFLQRIRNITALQQAKIASAICIIILLTGLITGLNIPTIPPAIILIVMASVSQTEKIY